MSAQPPVHPPIPLEAEHHPLWADHWHVMRKWWSVRIGVWGTLVIAGIPALNDQFPNLAPVLLHWFPNHGQQWIPIAGAVIAMATRVISQDFVMARLRQFFKVDPNAQ